MNETTPPPAPRDTASQPPQAIVLTKVNSLIPSVAYGPIASRRLGNSLGVNLLPADLKICSFNCPYCECGWTNVGRSRRDLDSLPWPTPARVEHEVREALQRCLDQQFPIHYITMAGNGEPTMHPQFDEAVAAIRRVRDQLFPQAKVAVLSNAMHLDSEMVRRTLDTLDERMMKLDGGTEEMIKLIDHPLFPFEIERVVANIASLRDCVVQSMFVAGRFTNATEAELEAWMAHIARIRPKYVQIYSIERRPPDATLQPVPKDRLREIAARLLDVTGIEGRVYG